MVIKITQNIPGILLLPCPPVPVFSRVKTGFYCDCCYYKVLILTKREKASVVVTQLSHNSSNVISEFFLKTLSFLDTPQKIAEEKCSFTKVTEKHCHYKSTQSFSENGLFSNIMDAAKAVIKERRKGMN